MSRINLNDPRPLYEQVESDIKRRISDGEFAVGDMLKSQNELVKEYDVSLITIKKALSNLIRDGVLFSRVGKGTFVANEKSKLDLHEHRSIGVVLQNLEHPFFAPVVENAEQEAYEEGYNILLSSSSGNSKKEQNQINHFKKIGVSGLIIASLSLIYKASRTIRKLHEEGFPYVMISYMHDPDIWFVGTDHELGGYLAGEHLVKSGYKEIGCVHAGRQNILGEVRKNGFYRALTEHDTPIHSDYIYYLEDTLDRYKAGYDVGKQFTKLKKRPEALFIYTDSAALGFQKAVLEAGMRIPEDVAIIGYNDIEMARYATVPLSTIRQPSSAIGKKATEVLIKRIAGVEVPNRTIVKPELVVRESTVKKSAQSKTG